MAAGGAGRSQHERREVSGARGHDEPRLGVDEHDERRDDPVGRDLPEELLEAGEQGAGREPLERQCAGDAAQLPHDRCREEVVPLDVGHDEQQLTATERDDVVPVAADLDPGSPGR